MKEPRTEQIGFRITKRQHDLLRNMANVDGLSSPHEMARYCVEHYLSSFEKDKKPIVMSELERTINSSMSRLNAGVAENTRILQETQQQIDQVVEKRAATLNQSMAKFDKNIAHFRDAVGSLDNTLRHHIYPLLLGKIFIGVGGFLLGMTVCFLYLLLTGWIARLLS